MNLIRQSLVWMKSRGFDTERLENSFRLLCWTNEMIKQNFYQ